MDTTTVLIFAAIAVFGVYSAVGRRQLTPFRFILPLILVGVAASNYLKSFPTIGGDLAFDVVCTLIGIGLGLLSGALIKVTRDSQSGSLMTEAGIPFALVWVAVFGGRIAFGYAANGIWSDAVRQFSIQHEITGAAAWTTALVLMALATALARLAVTATRAALVMRQTQTQPQVSF